MNSLNVMAAAAALTIAGLVATTASAGVTGNYTRPNGTKARVYMCGGKLCGKLTSGKKKGYEMLHGMAKVGANKWKGRKMKHPDMPAFMTFNGTITRSGKTLTVKGCMIGGIFCDKEKWTRTK